MNSYLSKHFTSTEIVRIVDLAKRRMIDYGVEEYGPGDQDIFKKMQDMKTTKKNRRML